MASRMSAVRKSTSIVILVLRLGIFRYSANIIVYIWYALQIYIFEAVYLDHRKANPHNIQICYGYDIFFRWIYRNKYTQFSRFESILQIYAIK